MTRCALRPAAPTTTSSTTFSSSWSSEPHASCQLPNASDRPSEAAAGIVVTEMNTPISALARASVSETTPTRPARMATMTENAFGELMRSATGRTPCTNAAGTWPAPRTASANRNVATTAARNP